MVKYSRGGLRIGDGLKCNLYFNQIQQLSIWCYMVGRECLITFYSRFFHFKNYIAFTGTKEHALFFCCDRF